MDNKNNFKDSYLNQLSTEIIFFSGTSIEWFNESAQNNGWKLKDNIPLPLEKLFDKGTAYDVKSFVEDINHRKNSTTKRNFELRFATRKKRIVDITGSWSEKYNLTIVEIQNIDNLNKIIDSTKTFSMQKVAANLARTLAHEVKNPLSGIKGSAQILSGKYNDDFSKKFLNIIVDETERLNEIVTKILTPSKKPSFEYFNIHEVLEKVYALSEADKDNEIPLARDYDPSIPEIFGDASLFIQAILNIMTNAKQALKNTNKPRIRIKSRIVYGQPINGIVHSTSCSITISDNGPGIPSEIQEQIFFPMVSSKDQGSGLGLSISQDIIRVHGGTITFNSDDKGAEFSILIPINKHHREVKSA